MLTALAIVALLCLKAQQSTRQIHPRPSSLGAPRHEHSVRERVAFYATIIAALMSMVSATTDVVGLLQPDNPSVVVVIEVAKPVT
ncbi:hypothetical protein [Actinoplanes sp. NPDC023714]|uniref:hypothetical protein n=1 Tax=Actinoplanes sp. NPDC023714 TaxID=3154322 RepID=UPI0033F1876C